MKKMRRMIPALCMLLVSAIMLSTASYAWFTINDQVTATGMQVQAQASGSLVVGAHPLGDTDKGNTTIKLETAQQNLAPVTWITKNEAADYGIEGATADAWYKAVDADHTTGEATGFTDQGVMISGATYIDQVIYIGSAGEALTGQSLTIDISSAVHAAGDKAYNAYAAAIYVYEQGQTGKWGYTTDTDGEKVEYLPDPTEAPAAVIRVAAWNNSSLTGTGDDVAATLKNNVATLTKKAGEAEVGYDIPSVIGLESEDSKVGIKIVIRVFVDGNLKNYDLVNKQFIEVPVKADTYTEIVPTDTTYVEGTYYKLEGETYTEVTGLTEGAVISDYYYEVSEGQYELVGKIATTYGSIADYENTVFYEMDDSGNYVPANKKEWNENKVVDGYYLYAGEIETGETAQEYCVNSDNVPTTAASLEFKIKAASIN